MKSRDIGDYLEDIGVDRKILWSTAQHDIPPLERILEKIIAEISDN